MSTIEKIKNCCGCKTCSQICPQDCIEFIDDEEGFWIPEINRDKCVNCGLCFDACPQMGYSSLNRVIKTYAGIHKSTHTLVSSTSGGGMTAIAEQILLKGGVVYGTYLDTNDWRAKFARADKPEELLKFRGSKYVQSDVGSIYREIRIHLNTKRDVLFIGVPCQVAGLYKFLGRKDIGNLYTIDILCHGVPSPKLFIEHVKYLENKFHKKLTGFAFRDKTKFPNKTALKYKFSRKVVCVLGKCEPYFNAFISGASYRMSCYECQFAKEERVGDITLGDYWGIEKAHSDFDNSLGVSLILANTEKGLELVNHANMYLVESDLKKAIKGNGILREPSQMSKCRSYFYKDIDLLGYAKAIEKNISTYPQIYNYVLTHMPKKVIKMLARL